MKSAVKNASIYIALDWIQKSLGFFLLPLYTAYLTPRDYGIVAVANSIGSFLAAFFGLSLNSVVSRFYYKYREDVDRVRVVWGTVLTLTILVSVGMSLLFGVFHRFLLDPFAPGISFIPFLLLMVVSQAFSPIYALYQKSLQARQEGARFAANNLAWFFANVGLTLLFVVAFRWGAAGVLGANLAVNLVFAGIAALRFLPQVKLGIDRTQAREALAYSLPLVPHQLAGKIGGTFDRLFLNGSTSASATGLYNVGAQLSGMLATAAAAVNQAYSPWFFEKAEGKQDSRDQVRRVAYALTDLYVLGGVAVALVSREVVMIMTNPSFHAAWMAIPILAFAAVMTGIYYVVSNSLFLNRTKIIPAITVTSTAINVGLNLLLIPRFSFMGAAAASAVSQLCQAGLSSIFARRSYTIRYGYLRIFGVAFLGFGVASLAWLLQPGLVGLLIKAGALILLAAAYFLAHRASLGALLGDIKRRKGKAGSGQEEK